MRTICVKVATRRLSSELSATLEEKGEPYVADNLTAAGYGQLQLPEHSPSAYIKNDG